MLKYDATNISDETVTLIMLEITSNDWKDNINTIFRLDDTSYYVNYGNNNNAVYYIENNVIVSIEFIDL